MKIAYVTCVKNEQDLIYPNLMYHKNMGVDSFYVMFNNSEDNTQDEVSRFEKDTGITVTRFHDNDTAYRQPTRFTMMSNRAYGEGATWIIPVDADEIVRTQDKSTFKEFLSRFDNRFSEGYINCRWLDYHATDKDNLDDPNYFTRWKYRQTTPRQASKIIVKWHPDMRYGDGHHIIVTRRNLIAESRIMWYAHFFGRSQAQLQKKTEIIGQAFVQAFGEASNRPQVTNYHAVKAQGQSFHLNAWEKLCAYRRDHFNDLLYDPIPENLFRK